MQARVMGSAEMTERLGELDELLRSKNSHAFGGNDDYLEEQVEWILEQFDPLDWVDLGRLIAERDGDWVHNLVVVVGRFAPRDQALILLDKAWPFTTTGEAQQDHADAVHDLLQGDRAAEALTARTDDIAPGLQRVRFLRNGAQMTYLAVVHALRDEYAFRNFFHTTLAACPFEAFYWETPGTTKESCLAPFECILRDAPVLTRRAADPAPFRAQFGDATDAVTFQNLGGDATLVAPVPRGIDYPHLAAFIRQAPAQFRAPLWRQVAFALLRTLGEQPLWLSTSGAGVAWLHVRIDARPKYYTFDAYRRVP